MHFLAKHKMEFGEAALTSYNFSRFVNRVTRETVAFLRNIALLSFNTLADVKEMEVGRIVEEFEMVSSLSSIYLIPNEAKNNLNIIYTSSLIKKAIVSVNLLERDIIYHVQRDNTESFR